MKKKEIIKANTEAMMLLVSAINSLIVRMDEEKPKKDLFEKVVNNPSLLGDAAKAYNLGQEFLSKLNKPKS